MGKIAEDSAGAGGVRTAARAGSAAGGGVTGGGGGGGGGAGAGAAGGGTKAVNLAVDFRLWAEYFNSPLRCWEPLLEPFSGRAAVETSAARGAGVVAKIDCPLHVNVTGALLDTMDDAIRIVGHISGRDGVRGGGSGGHGGVGVGGGGLGGGAPEARGAAAAAQPAAPAELPGAAGPAPRRLFRGEEEHEGSGRVVKVVHKHAPGLACRPSGLADQRHGMQTIGGGAMHSKAATGRSAGRSGDGSAAFMIRNLTGAPMRVYQVRSGTHVPTLRGRRSCHGLSNRRDASISAQTPLPLGVFDTSGSIPFLSLQKIHKFHKLHLFFFFCCCPSAIAAPAARGHG